MSYVLLTPFVLALILGFLVAFEDCKTMPKEEQ
jgi:hypothetical protein